MKINEPGMNPSHHNVKQQVIKLFQKMRMEVQENEVVHAFRVGQRVGKKFRKTIVHCQPSLRPRVFNYTRNLQGLQNNQNAFYFVNQQYPDEYEAERQEWFTK